MLASLRRILALIRKELLAILSDPRSRYTIFVPPVLQCLIFGYAATYDLSHVPYAVLDQDRSGASREFLARLDGSRVFERIANLTRAADIASVIDQREALLVIQIEQNFERRLQAGTNGYIQVIADGRNSNTAGTALGYVNAIVQAFNTDWATAHGQATAPLQITSRGWYNPNLETRWNMVPALIGTLTMLQTLLLTAMSVAREREQGTFDQLLVTPFRPAEIMVGKAIPSMIIGTIQASSILLVAQLWFRIPFEGSYVTLYAGLGLFLLAAVGVGLLLMPFTLLSGLAAPLSNMPPIFQYLTLADPLRFAIDIAQRVYLEGIGLDRLGPDLWPLAIMALITLSGAAWMFRHGIE
jgi:ABC-2 type transport system permease protein